MNCISSSYAAWISMLPNTNKIGNSNARQQEIYATPLIWKSADHELETKHNNKFTNKYVIYKQ